MIGGTRLPAIEGRLYHLGIAVRDIDEAMSTYRTLLGIPAFHRLDTNYRARHRDWEGIIANKNAFGKWGSLLVELVEPGLGDGPAQEYLQTHGPGMFHVGYATHDSTQRPGGIRPCFEVESTKRPDGTYGIVYLDTMGELGYFVELVDQPLADRIIAIVDALSACEVP
jgi:catechol 2,3-dioxygenase-like lactoylglutathione lyase family enzyme